MRMLVPSERDHATSALPELSIAVSGLDALWFGSEIVCAGVHEPVAVRVEYWMRKKDPSERVHTEITLPDGSTATSGSKPSCPASEMLIADRNVGVACAGAAKTSSVKAKTAKSRRTATRETVTIGPPG